MRRSSIVACLILGCSSGGGTDAPAKDAEGIEEEEIPRCDLAVSKGPWVLAVDATHAKVRWESCRPAPSGIKLAVESGGAEIARPSLVTPRKVETTNAAPLRFDADFPGTYYMHEVALDGLAPGSCYRYSLDSEPSIKGRFCTSRASGQPFAFVAVADTNPGFGPTAKLLEQVYAPRAPAGGGAPTRPDFTIHGGDLHYYSSGLETYQFWFGEMRTMFRSGAFFHSIGNHESEQPKEREEYVDAFWGNAGFDGTKDYFRFESGGVWFFALDTEQDAKITSTQGTWLEKQLDDASKRPGHRFSVVYFHRPWVTCGDKADSSGNRNAYRALFERTKVKLVVQGHMHAYERFELDDVTWLTVGGGGGALGNPDENAARPECASRKASGKFFHAVRIDVSATGFAGTTIDDKGAVRDTFSRAL